MTLLGPASDTLQRTLYLACVVAAFFIYLAASKPTTNPNEAGNHHYLYLAKGFKAGHLYMEYEPNPRLLALENPYDFKQNHMLRLHDGSLYQNKYYTYYGIAPVLSMYLPALYLGFELSDHHALVILCWLTFFGWATLLRHWVKINAPELPLPALLFGYVAVLSGTYAPFMLSYARVYEVAIFSGQAGIAWALTLAWLGNQEGYSRMRCWFGASVALGFAFASRPNLIFVLPFLFYLLASGIKLETRKTKAALAALGPAVCTVLGLALYNYARFGKFSETGMSYVTTDSDPKEWHIFKADNIFPGFCSYFMGAYERQMPYTYFNGFDSEWYATKPYEEYAGKCGQFVGNTFLFLLPMGLTLKHPTRWCDRKLCLGLLVSGVLQLLFLCWMWPYSMLRYHVDIAGLFCMAGVLASYRWILLRDTLWITVPLFILLVLYGSGIVWHGNFHNYYK